MSKAFKKRDFLSKSFLILLLLGFISLGTIGGCNNNGGDNLAVFLGEHVVDDARNPGYLYVISGTSGSLEGDKLTLNGVPSVIYFSDRPARIAGHMSLSSFIKMWNKGSDSFRF